MAFTTTAINIGDSTKKTDYDRLMANNVYNRSFKTIDSKSANYTVLDTDTFAVLYVTTGAADKTITLPTASDNTDRVLKIMKIDSAAGSCIADGEGAETINGTTTWEITEQYGYIQIQCDGSEWFVIDKNDCCIYELIDTTSYAITTAWADYMTLSDLTAGKYFIYYNIVLVLNGAGTLSVTLATTVDTEDSADYTHIMSVAGTTFNRIEKTFKREFLSTTSLYLNGKEATAQGTIDNANYGSGFIRARRIG